MKNWLVAIALILIGAALVYYFTYSPRDTAAKATETTSFGRRGLDPATAAQPGTASTERAFSSDASGTESNSPVSSLQPRLAGQQTPDIPGALPSSAPERTNISPEVVIENMRIAIRDYGARFGGNPVGDNAEITRALDGDNPKQVKFIRPDSGLQINSKGELVDPWGTPFFFHQLSGTQTEIRSAGPDKKMYTADDLVIQ